ncbi:MAG: polysaccharide deacetylase family protein [Clostridia bacterium]
MIFVLKKRTLIVVAICMLVAILTTGGMFTSQAIAKSRKVPIYAVDVGQTKKIAITFDAAWGADKTKGILDILQKNDCKATFFLVGFWIKNFPDMVKEINACGMEIGNHSDNHLKMSTLTVDDIKKELDTVNNGVYKLIGKKTKYFRAPFGDYNNNLIAEAENLGYTPIQWSVDSLDWKGLSGSEICKRVLNKAENGSIILCHNNSDHILEALPIILKELKLKGFSFVTMSELVYKENFNIDNSGIQHLNSK